MSRWSLIGPWGKAVVSTTEEGLFVWKAEVTDNAVLMQDLLETARSEYPADGRWFEAWRYTPDLLGEAVRRVHKEFGGAVKLLEGNPPAPDGVIF